MPIESERRFYVESSLLPTYEHLRVVHQTGPNGATEKACIEIEQVYLGKTKGFSARVRKSTYLWAGRPVCYQFTIKGPGTVTRSEDTVELSKSDGESLLRQTLPRVKKIRHLYQIDGRVWEVDEFLDGLKGLWLAEVEAPEAELERVSVPPFCVSEVTEDPAYSNYSLAQVSETLANYRSSWLRSGL